MPTDLSTRRVLAAFEARTGAELPDEVMLVRDVATGESPTGGDAITQAVTIAEGVPALIELGVPGVTVAADQLEEGTIVTVRMRVPDDEVAVPRQGDRLYVMRWADASVIEPLPIMVLGTARPRSYETLMLVTGRQVRG